jgi:hypothetical protein
MGHEAPGINLAGIRYVSSAVCAGLGAERSIFSFCAFYSVKLADLLIAWPVFIG